MNKASSSYRTSNNPSYPLSWQTSFACGQLFVNDDLPKQNTSPLMGRVNCVPSSHAPTIRQSLCKDQPLYIVFPWHINRAFQLNTNIAGYSMLGTISNREGSHLCLDANGRLPIDGSSRAVPFVYSAVLKVIWTIQMLFNTTQT